jgi:hypothetical protein
MKAVAFMFACFVIGGTVGGSLAVVVHKPVARLEHCMVYLPDMPDSKFKRWCLKQSERMP